MISYVCFSHKENEIKIESEYMSCNDRQISATTLLFVMKIRKMQKLENSICEVGQKKKKIYVKKKDKGENFRRDGKIKLEDGGIEHFSLTYFLVRNVPYFGIYL